MYHNINTARVAPATQDFKGVILSRAVPTGHQAVPRRKAERPRGGGRLYAQAQGEGPT